MREKMIGYLGQTYGFCTTSADAAFNSLAQCTSEACSQNTSQLSVLRGSIAVVYGSLEPLQAPPIVFYGYRASVLVQCFFFLTRSDRGEQSIPSVVPDISPESYKVMTLYRGTVLCPSEESEPYHKSLGPPGGDVISDLYPRER